MNYIKFLKKSFNGYLLLSLLILSSCTFYKTLEVTPVMDETLNAVFEFRKFVVIHNDDTSKEYFVSAMVIEKDSISGVIMTPPKNKRHVHKPMSKSFRKGNTAYPPLSTIHIYSSIKEINLGAFTIPFEDIKKVEIHHKAEGKSFLASFGVTVVVIAASIAVGLAGIAANGGILGDSDDFPIILGGCTDLVCPLVESYGDDVKQFHGSLFPGAMFKSLKRDDYLFLTDYVSNQGGLKLRVFNDFPEVEYIDQLNLLEIKHQGFDKLGLNSNNIIVAYNEPDTAITAIGGQEDISHLLSAEDGELYDFDDATATDHLNAITLTFNRQDFLNHPYLVIKGKQSQWLETVTDFTFYNMGKNYDDWAKRKDNASEKKWKKKNVKQGVSLNVYLKKNNKWIYVGSHHDAGILAMRNLLMPLNLENIDSPNIEIKLECSYKFWEIDYVGLTNDWSDDLSIKQLEFSSARDEKGEDVSMKIKSTDDIYQVQDNRGTFIELLAEGISDQPNTSLVLHGSGYFHPIKNYEHEAGPKSLTQINSTLGLQDISRDLFFYKTIMPFVYSDQQK